MLAHGGDSRELPHCLFAFVSDLRLLGCSSCEAHALASLISILSLAARVEFFNWCSGFILNAGEVKRSGSHSGRLVEVATLILHLLVTFLVHLSLLF